MRDTLSAKYAFALYSLARDEGKVADYLPPLRDFWDNMQESEELYSFLCSYSVPKSSKEKIIKTMSQAYKLEHLESFLLLLSKKHVLRKLGAIIEDYESYSDEELGIKRGVVFSPYQLEPAEVARLEKALSKRLEYEVKLTPRIDHRLIGGVKISLDGKVYDGSVQNRLNEMKKSLLGKGGKAQ